MEEQNQKSNAALREEKILEFWRENNTFQKSLDKESPKGNYVFYDGPPFATGQMHYGHILGSTAKDAIGRYQTMQGFHVPRRWGWDCHGLPIENIVEKELGIAGHKEIEALGIEKFVEYARSKVLQYDKDWESGVERIGRWVDFKGGYKTMDNTFIESVWWALGELNNKGLIYEGVRVLAYCSRCETPIANSEIAMDNSYKDITDISVYVKFELVDTPNTFVLVWTTTPWTLPGNFALAYNPDFNYVKVKIPAHPSGGENYFYILAKDRLECLKVPYEIVEENFSLKGLHYKPIFDYFVDKIVEHKENAWKLYEGKFVTNDAGTGIVHMSPGYGEDDMNLAKAENIPFMHHVLNDGTFAEAVRDFVGLSVKPKSTEKDGHQKTDIEIIKHLAHQGHLFAKEKIVHAYPHCMRCDTPIIYYALPSWFVNIQKVKADILREAESMTWIPAHLKEGRFKNSVEAAPDWTISRNRYWASPLPIWKSESGKMMFVSGLEDLKKKTKKSGNKYFIMRHGGTEGNLKELVSFKNEALDHLTERGQQQVRSEMGHYKDKIDLIICSPFARTHETAKIAKEELGIEADIIVDQRLHELNPGEYDGKNWHDYHTYIYTSGKEWFDRQVPGGESLRDVQKRIGEFIYEIEKEYKDKNILIITHGGPAWLFFVNAGLFRPENDEYQMANTQAFVPEFKRFQNAEIRELPFVPLPHNKSYEIDLHRPYIDAITLVDEKGEEYTRIPEVIDCWFESGSMPFAQDHYPFERPDWKEKNFPAGFVAEYVGQTRTWYYYTHAISTILFGHAPFEHIVTTGTLRAEDGQKISKSKKNYPDPWIFIDKYGVDALRIYLMSGPLMKGEDANFSEKTVADIANKIIGRLYNVLAFYELYRDKDVEQEKDAQSSIVLDQWIMSRLNQLVAEVTKGMDVYDMAEATRPFDLFVDDLSTWYLRRSRDRIKDGSLIAKITLYTVLKTVAKLLAPFAPFAAEDIWRTLRNENDEESVHLVNWPSSGKSDEDAIVTMQIIRNIITFGLEARQKVGIKVRQPLTSFKFQAQSGTILNDHLDLIKDELNVKEVIFDKSIGDKVELDTEITSELKKEGDYRELLRGVQDLRKKTGLNPSDTITLTVSTNEIGQELIEKFKTDFMKTAGLKGISFADNDGEEIKIDELLFKVKIS